MVYETRDLILRPLKEEEAPLLKDYLIRNRAFMKQWVPQHKKDYISLESITEMIRRENEATAQQSALILYIFKKGENKVIGCVKLNNIVYGVFLSCFAGYMLDKDELNKGYMTQALKKAVSIAFEELKLHRIEANIMPRNCASKRVVEKLGFVFEGTASKYLKINGRWEDHNHYVLLNEAIE